LPRDAAVEPVDFKRVGAHGEAFLAPRPYRAAFLNDKVAATWR
jgi:hypothetical protein